MSQTERWRGIHPQHAQKMANAEALELVHFRIIKSHQYSGSSECTMKKVAGNEVREETEGLMSK